MIKTLYVWITAHINRDYIETLEKDLVKHGYTNIQCSVPMVRVLKKQFKGKDTFTYVPLLFNYGFIKIPINILANRDIMDNIIRDIKGISSWVKDPVKKTPSKSTKGMGILETLDTLPYAIVSGEEVRRLQHIAENDSIHSITETSKVKPGDTVTLYGYPFEGLVAKIQKININKRVVTVTINLFSGPQQATLSLDSIMYTIYRNGYDVDEGNKELLNREYSITNYTGEEQII